MTATAGTGSAAHSHTQVTFCVGQLKRNELRLRSRRTKQSQQRESGKETGRIERRQSHRPRRENRAGKTVAERNR